jgi:protein ImuB
MFACIYTRNLPDGVVLSDFAYAFSPLVEETAVDTVVIDVEGCDLLFGSAYELANEIANRAARRKESGGLGCRVNVAVAANPDTAIHVAKFFNGITFIAPGEELTGLGDLPIEELGPKSQVQSSKPNGQTLDSIGPKSKIQSPRSDGQTLDIGHWTLDEKRIAEVIETLQLWGVRTFREFAALPVAGVSERLGQEGIRLQQLASGKTDRHLKLTQPEPVFANSIELDHPLAELEPLAFILARLLNQLCAGLNAYALATNELRVQLKLADGTAHERTLNLPYPMRDHKVFLKLLLLDTEMHPPPAAVLVVSLACEPVKPRVLQNGLFIPLAPEPEKLELTLARLAKLVGPNNLGSPELLATHRPDAFRVKRFALRRPNRASNKNTNRKRNHRVSASPSLRVQALPVMAFRFFRPPLRALVQGARGYPTEISAWGANRSVHGRVVRLAGPWRTSGDWWRTDTWARDEWDVTVEGRAGSAGQTGPPAQVLCRIYRELRSGTWFVEGVYD